MKKIVLLTLLMSLFMGELLAQKGSSGTISIGLLKYNGGGDWYSNPTSLPNLIEYCNDKLQMDIAEDPVTVEVGSPEIFNIPLLHMTGHGNVVFSDDEAENLRTYLEGGGFLHIDDNYGMDPFVRPSMKKVFPELEFVEIPFSHQIYKEPYVFTNGVPKIHEHDSKVPQAFGLFFEGRMVCFYTFEVDLGDGWEDPAVHNDPPEVRTKALQMGANLVQFAFTQ